MKKGTMKLLMAGLCGSMLTVGVLAATDNVDVTALLNRGLTIQYNGKAQELYDANGARVYPLTYNGTTYLPVRAVAGLFGTKVDWDGANNTVLLGEAEAAQPDARVTSLFDIKPYATTDQQVSDKIKEIGGTTYGKYMNPWGKAYYRLDGKYTKLTLTMYNNWQYDSNPSFSLLSGQEELKEIATVKLPYGTYTTQTYDMTGVQELIVTSRSTQLYILKAELE